MKDQPEAVYPLPPLTDSEAERMLYAEIRERWKPGAFVHTERKNWKHARDIIRRRRGLVITEGEALREIVEHESLGEDQKLRALRLLVGIK
jgi:hypothetical protein